MNKVSLDLNDFLNLLAAATFGAEKAAGFKAEHTVRAWHASIDKISDLPLSDERTAEQRNESYLESFAAECAQYGAD